MLRSTRPLKKAVTGSSFRALRPECVSHQLANGVRIAVNPNPSYFSALGIFVDAGSRYETPRFLGVSHLMDRLAFKSTKSRSDLQMQEELESLGGNYMCAASRESMMYQASVFNSDAEQMLQVLADTALNPVITGEEVASQKETARYEIQETWRKPELILPELVHTQAYKDGGLGNSLLCPRERIDIMTPQLVHEYRDALYTADRIVVAFVGVEEHKALDWTQRLFGALAPQSSTSHPLPPSKYTGGELCVPSSPPIGNQPDLVHLHIAFEGLPIGDEDIYSVATLQTLLGGGGSFSAGGPGKGMYSRLYTQVLNQYGFVENCQSYNHSYKDSGLVGISAASVPQAGQYLAEIICRQMSLLWSHGPGSPTYSEVERAKKQLRSSLLMNLESKMVELEDMGRQVQLQRRKIPTTEMCRRIESVSVEDIARVSQRIFSGQASPHGSGKPTIVMQGQRDQFGNVDSVLRKYDLGVTTPKGNWWAR